MTDSVNQIIPGPFCECVKTGCFFSMETDDRVFVGDLFYDFAKREFQMRGIPSLDGQRRDAIPPKERGPVMIHLLVGPVLEIGVRSGGTYQDIRFQKAKCSPDLSNFVHNWYGDRSVCDAIANNWEIADGQLAWVRGTSIGGFAS